MAVVVWQPQNKLLNVNNNTCDSKTDDKDKESPDSSVLNKGDNNNFLPMEHSTMR